MTGEGCSEPLAKRAACNNIAKRAIFWCRSAAQWLGTEKTGLRSGSCKRAQCTERWAQEESAAGGPQINTSRVLGYAIQSSGLSHPTASVSMWLAPPEAERRETMAARSEHEVSPTHVMTVPAERAPSFAAQPPHRLDHQAGDVGGEGETARA